MVSAFPTPGPRGIIGDCQTLDREPAIHGLSTNEYPTICRRQSTEGAFPGRAFTSSMLVLRKARGRVRVILIKCRKIGDCLPHIIVSVTKLLDKVLPIRIIGRQIKNALPFIKDATDPNAILHVPNCLSTDVQSIDRFKLFTQRLESHLPPPRSGIHAVHLGVTAAAQTMDCHRSGHPEAESLNKVMSATEEGFTANVVVTGI